MLLDLGFERGGLTSLGEETERGRSMSFGEGTGRDWHHQDLR